MNWKGGRKLWREPTGGGERLEGRREGKRRTKEEIKGIREGGIYGSKSEKRKGMKYGPIGGEAYKETQTGS